MNGFFSQLPFKRYLPEVASAGDCLNICPWVASRLAHDSEIDFRDVNKKCQRYLFPVVSLPNFQAGTGIHRPQGVLCFRHKNLERCV